MSRTPSTMVAILNDNRSIFISFECRIGLANPSLRPGHATATIAE